MTEIPKNIPVKDIKFSRRSALQAGALTVGGLALAGLACRGVTVEVNYVDPYPKLLKAYPELKGLNISQKETISAAVKEIQVVNFTDTMVDPQAIRQSLEALVKFEGQAFYYSREGNTSKILLKASGFSPRGVYAFVPSEVPLPTWLDEDEQNALGYTVESSGGGSISVVRVYPNYAQIFQGYFPTDETALTFVAGCEATNTLFRPTDLFGRVSQENAWELGGYALGTALALKSNDENLTYPKYSYQAGQIPMKVRDFSAKTPTIPEDMYNTLPSVKLLA